jgi:microsomal epoxide hydrolase
MPLGRIEPFEVHVPDETLADLRRRLEATRWSADVGNEDEYYGIGTARLRELVDYWRRGFDWRAAEARINALSHHRLEIDGVPIHFVRQAGKGPNPIPIVQTHGWPWTFWDWSKVIGPLTDPAAHGGSPEDAFEVSCPRCPDSASRRRSPGPISTSGRWRTCGTP